jgi:hypothetical protein
MLVKTPQFASDGDMAKGGTKYSGRRIDLSANSHHMEKEAGRALLPTLPRIAKRERRWWVGQLG